MSLRLLALLASVALLIQGAACSRGESSSGSAPAAAATAPSEPASGATVVGEVNGRPLYKPFYDKNLLFIQERLSRDAGSADVERYLNAPFEAFDMLVQDELLFQEAEKRGLAATEAEAEAEMRRAARAAGGEDRYLAALKAQGLTRRLALDGLRRKLSVDRLVSEQITKPLTVTEAEAIAWYNQNLARFTPELWLRAWHIFIACPANADPARVQRALDHTRAILDSIRRGADFEHMAREHSEDATAADGGSLGRIKKGYAPPEFDAVAFRMAEGEISDPVRTEKGFHIIRAGEKTGGSPRPYEEVAEACRKAVLTQKQKAALQEHTARLRASAQVVSNLP